ncbi:putative N-carbamoylsarcosine amidase [Microdochium trichocladiopsis]|uniref:N-carbamoylsarcosine amidase n=1 Tax=Microdochium trichocladiopsis TaxID=1682393 RepID=A0A9P9BQA7_9PEZI|nr:putative N-carbamoylsarcosine amidase [Microdochium trichocladiopsis]KAH7025677.1 putative N-carbamoylsarcosine amidase [Microdochium trichocladiopsis]
MSTLTLAAHPQHNEYLSKSLGAARLGWGSRPALLLIDVCAAYWKQGSPLDISHNPEGAASPDSMRRLLGAAQANNVPVAWAQVRYNHPQLLDGGVQAKKTKTIRAWQDGDERGLDALVPGLEPGEHETLVLKRNPSAFFGTTLATELMLQGVDTVVICGVSTSGCVRATAVDAMCHGFRPMIVHEACGDRSLLIQQQNLFDVDSFFGDVISETEALDRFSHAQCN